MLSSSHGLLVRVIIPGNRKKMTRVKEKKKRLRENTNLWSTIASQRLVLSYFVRETAKDNNSKAKESFKKGGLNNRRRIDVAKDRDRIKLAIDVYREKHLH